MEIIQRNLENGLRVLYVPTASETVTVMVMSRVGSRFETKETNGIAHFLEHMLFKGTHKRPKARVIAEAIEGIGGDFNAFTAKDHTAYYAKVGSKHLEAAIDVISDIFLNATLPARELAKERGTIIEEIHMYEDLPMRSVVDVFEALLFGKDTPLGRTILGPQENIASIPRNKFLTFLREHYTIENSVVVIAGGLSVHTAHALTTKYFASVRKGTHSETSPFIPAQKKSRIAIKAKKTDQTHIVVGVPAFPHRHKDEHVLAVLSALLGGGMSSRLFSEVREKRGLAYYVRSYIETFSDTGYFGVRAGVSHRNAYDAVRIVLQELRKIARAPVTATELRKAKEYTKGTLALSLETSDALAAHIAFDAVVRDHLEPLEATYAHIERVTPADIQRVAKDIFKPEHVHLALVGPHAPQSFETLIS